MNLESITLEVRLFILVNHAFIPILVFICWIKLPSSDQMNRKICLQELIQVGLIALLFYITL